MGTTGQSITLANSIIGVGILAMPFCFQQCGVLLASLILVLMGLVSRLSCYFLLKSAFITKRRNFEFLAFHAFGSAGKLAVEVGIIGFLMGTCIAYFVVVGDLGPQIISKLLNINQSDILRTSIMIIVSVVCVLPLGLLRNVDSLSNVSAATICFYFCLVMKVIVEAASQVLTHDWYERMELWKPAGVLQCVPIFSMALFCQTQLFEIFESLPTLSMEKMNVVTKNAINICTSMYFTLGLFGYIAFSSQEISGNVLVSLSPTMGNDVIKLGFVLSLAFSFPLIIFPCRASLYSFLYKKVHSYHHDHIVNHSIPETSFRCITVVIIAAALVVGLMIPNIELVLGLLGSTIGVMICVVFPAACFVHVTFKDTNERLLAKLLLVLGLVIMVLGTYANLQAAEKLDRLDDKITPERIDKIVQEFFDAKKSEQSDEVIFKPLLNQRDDKPNEAIKNDPEIVKDSEIQPPNPVPPESVSNEKEEQKKPEINHIDENNLKEVLPDDKIKVLEVDDKVSDEHPKNVNEKVQEGKQNVNVDKIIMPVEKTNIETKPLLQEKNDLDKQKELIETIKQHGEEQKELMKEQKEILSELKKTQEEMKQSKKEVDSNEAKKIAVESIQKIANMAIQSLSGVSDMPLPENKPLEKTANDAVKEIAKKAVETIEAIKDIKEKPKETLNKIDGLINNNLNNTANLVPHALVPNVPSKLPNIDQPHMQLQNVQNNVQSNAPNLNLPNVAIQSHNQNIQSPNNNQGIPHPPYQQENINQNAASNINTINVQDALSNQISNQQVNEDKAIRDKQEINNPQAAIANKIEQKLSDIKNLKPIDEHSHSPDEPQSYKEGEEAQKNIILNNIAQNVPLPIAINSKADNVDQIKQIVQEKRVLQNVNNNIPGAAIVQSNGNKPQNLINQDVDAQRQKREVVDCTQKTTLKPEDKAICMSLFNDATEDILKNVDLNDKLQRNLPLDTNSIHHIRSLKSYDAENR